MNSERYAELRDNLFEKLRLESVNRIAIERETLGQTAHSKWFLYKRERLTASHFGKVCNRKAKTQTSKTVKEILYQKDLSKIPAIGYGIAHEAKALQDLFKKLGKDILPSGLFIDKDLHYLGASPDGLINDSEIVEVKCLLSIDGMELNDVWKDKKYRSARSIFMKNDIQKMNKKHKYYHQVQGQLHISGRNVCHFAIWNGREIHNIVVNRDDTFWKNHMEPKLSKFYNDCLAPEIIDPRLVRRMPLREPDWVTAARGETTEDSNQQQNNSKAKKKKKIY